MRKIAEVEENERIRIREERRILAERESAGEGRLDLLLIRRQDQTSSVSLIFQLNERKNS